jgi:hypothetical protein
VPARPGWCGLPSFLALSDLGLTLLDLPRFLLDTAFRNGLLPRLTHNGVRAYFTQEFPKREGAVHQWAAPVLNKISGLIFDSDVRLMLAGRATLNFRDVLDRKLVALVHVPKGIIGERPSALIAAFIIARFRGGAGRADSRRRHLPPWTSSELHHGNQDISQSRKCLSLTLAHQYPDQLSTDPERILSNDRLAVLLPRGL